MRVIFYQLLRQILFYKDAFLNTGDNEALHQFRVNIRKSRSLLQSVRDIFEENITNRFIDALKLIANATNNKRDLDVFGEYLESLDDLEAEFILEEVERERALEDGVIREMMQGAEFERIINEWSVVLQEEGAFFQGPHAMAPLKASAATALSSRLKKMDIKLSNLDEAVEIEKFHAVRIEFKRLRYMLEYFGDYFHSSIFDETMIAAKKMQTLFGTLQDRDVQKAILGDLEEREEFCSDVLIVRGIEQLKEEINNDIYQIRTKILMKKRKLLDKQARCIEELEIFTLKN
jgi:CHAD domain-containing protein